MVLVSDLLPAVRSHNTCGLPKGSCSTRTALEFFYTVDLTWASLQKNFWWEMRRTHLSGCLEGTLQRSLLGQGRDVTSWCTVKKSIFSPVTANPALEFKQLKGIYTSYLQPRISKDVPLCHLIFTHVLLTSIEASSKYRHTFWKKIRRGS